VFAADCQLDVSVLWPLIVDMTMRWRITWAGFEVAYHAGRTMVRRGDA